MWLALAGCNGGTVVPPDDDTVADSGVTTLAGSPGGAGLADGVGNEAFFFHPYGIARDGDVLYMADGWGQSIRRFDPETRQVSTIAGVPGEPGLVNGAGGAAQFDYPCGLEVGPDGRIYVADRKNGRIRVVDPDTGETRSLEDANGVIEAAEPYDVTFDDDDNLYFTDLASCQLRRVNVVSLESEVVFGRPDECYSADGVALDARLGEPRGLAYHPDGLVFVTDRVGENVRALDLATGVVSTPFGSVGDGNFGFVDGTWNEARFHKPTGLAVDGQLLYVADSDNDAMRVANLDDGMVTTLAGIGINGNADGPGAGASFSWPVDPIVASDGDLYVIDPGGHSIRRVDLDDPAYEVSTAAGAVGNSGADDGIGTDVRMSEPRGLARGDDGVVWVIDTFNMLVRTLDVETGAVESVAGTPEVYGHADGIGDAAHFMTPTAGAWLDGKLYIVGTESHTVRVMDGSGEVTTLAGAPVMSGYADGVGEDARFSLPRDIVAGADGFLYVLENGNRSVRKLDPASGEVTTLLAPDDPDNPLHGPEGLVTDGAGTLYVTDYAACTLVELDRTSGEPVIVAGEAWDCREFDGVGVEARMDRPVGLDVDPASGLVYIASQDGRTVRVYDPATGSMTTLTGDPDVMAPVDGDLGEATFSSPIDVLVVGDALLVLDRYSAHVRRVQLP